METMNIAHNPHGNAGLNSAALLVAHSGCTLKNLSLGGCVGGVVGRRWNTLSPEQVDALELPSDDGAIFLGAAIATPHGCSLESLTVTNLGFTGQGITALAAAMFSSSSLKRLDITGNHFGEDDTAVKNLEHAIIGGGCRLEALVMRSCGLTLKQRHRLKELLKRRHRSKATTKLLSWRDECELGAAGSTLRKWLLDAASLKVFICVHLHLFHRPRF